MGANTEMRVGLVLGGGGAVGLAYHAGALAALEHELQWDPRAADVIVGTSAGAMVAALLRRGLSAGDLAAVAVERQPLSMPREVEAALRERPAFDPVGAHRWLLRRPRLPSVSVLGRLAMRPWTFDLAHALASVLPNGPIDITNGGGRLDELFGSTWPADDLHLCVVRQSDLRRVVFGRADDAAVWQAVAASCAIPGYFQPVEIGGATYLDGGVRSPTNADVLLDRPLDLVIVISPMSARRVGRYGYRSVVRRHAQSRLLRERRLLAETGVPSVAVEPGDSVTALAGLNFMSDRNVRAIVQATYFDTADYLATSDARIALAPLNSRTQRRLDLSGPSIRAVSS